MIPCLFKSVTGYACPGCGIQRAALLLWQGELKASIHQYPGLIPLMLLVVIIVFYLRYPSTFSKRFMWFWILFCFLIIAVSYVIKLCALDFQ